MSLAPGARVGPYEVLAPLGAGGMGEVYRARDTKLGRDVALKVLPAAFAGDPERLARFEREARTLAALNHPNIAQIYGIEGDGPPAGPREARPLPSDGPPAGPREARPLPSDGPPAGPREARPLPSDGPPAGQGDGPPAGRREARPPVSQPPVLVLELVEGPTLADRLASGAIPLPDAIPIARQIADALEAAHEIGIVHRDLKPANVKVRDDGTVKVLDFGLAKALAPDTGAAASDAMNSPTLTARATQLGVILGTAAYMAPEQARGKPVDRRADIWAFGVILYEMLTGRRAFEGEDVSTTLAAVLTRDPDPAALPAGLPSSVRRLLRRCLERDPRRRLSAIGDARLELDEPADAPAATPAALRPAPGWWRLGAAVGAAIAATAAVVLWLTGARNLPAGALERVTLTAPEGQELQADPAHVAVSPDGRRVAFVTGPYRGETRLWIRSLESLDAREVEGGVNARLPFWSPDGQSLAFFANEQLWVVPAAGGRPRSVAPAPDGRGGAWSASNVIVFAAASGGALSRVSANGGTVAGATALDAARQETGHRFPTFLPDGRHYLFVALPGQGNVFDIYVAAIDGGDAPRRLLAAESAPVYAAPGYLIYSRRSTLVAHPFDARRRELTGEAVPLDDLPGDINLEYTAAPAVSAAGAVLAYPSAGPLRTRLAWLDQSGREAGEVPVPAGPYMQVSIAPDGRRAVVAQLAAPYSSLWWVDLVRGALSPLTTAPAWNADAVWAPGGERVAFGSSRTGPNDLYVQAADRGGAEEVLYASPAPFKHPTAWSADGATIVFDDLHPDTHLDIWTLRVADRRAEPLLVAPGRQTAGTISPDGRWLAHLSDETGRYEAYVRPFRAPGRTHRLTTDGVADTGLWWRRDGRQIMAIGATGEILLIDVQPGAGFAPAAPRRVGRMARVPVNLTVAPAPDFQRLLAILPAEQLSIRTITLVRHWAGALSR